MNDKFDGPWQIPLKGFIKQFDLMVIVYNLKDDSIEKEIKLDYGNRIDRAFLGKLCYWCATNGRSVETLSLEDWKKEK